MLVKFFKFALILLFYQSPLYSKSKTLNDFNSGYLSNYFSGIIAYDNNDNLKALKFFKSSKYLIKQHNPYLKNYINTLVLEGKIQQAASEIKLNLTNDNSNFFEAHLLLALDSLKKKNYKKSKKHLQSSYEFINNDRLLLIVAETLKQYLYVFERNKISNIKNKFGNFSFINEVFQKCYLNDKNTKTYFESLINNENNTDYSRYIFFYINYLIENDQIEEAKAVSGKLKYINSTLLLSQSKSWVENKKFKEFSKIFSCDNHNDIVSEFLFLISNLYSSQDDIEKSNFYLNLSHYLNPKFILNSTLVAENFYLNGEYDKAKKILNNFDKKYKFYYWFRLKKEAQIIIQNKGYDEGIDYLSSKFSKIKNPNIKMIFDIANFYKNSKNYEKAIEYYTKIILSLSDNPEIKSDLLYRRGGSYERLGNYEKADEDLINSLKINPDDAYVLNYLAYSWLERDYKIDKAMEMLKKAYALRSNDPYITDSIGWAYYLIENYIEAEKYLKKAVELMPEDPTVNDHYGDILWKLNRHIQARYFWNYVLGLDEADDEIKKNINIKIIEGIKNS